MDEASSRLHRSSDAEVRDDTKKARADQPRSHAATRRPRSSGVFCGMILTLIILNGCFGNMTAHSWRDCRSYTPFGGAVQARALKETWSYEMGECRENRQFKKFIQKARVQNRPKVFRKLGAM